MKLLYIDCCISVNKVSHKPPADFPVHLEQPHLNDENLNSRCLELLPLNAKPVALREQASNEGRVDDPMFALVY